MTTVAELIEVLSTLNGDMLVLVDRGHGKGVLSTASTDPDKISVKPIEGAKGIFLQAERMPDSVRAILL